MELAVKNNLHASIKGTQIRCLCLFP